MLGLKCRAFLALPSTFFTGHITSFENAEYSALAVLGTMSITVGFSHLALVTHLIVLCLAVFFVCFNRVTHRHRESHHGRNTTTVAEHSAVAVAVTIAVTVVVVLVIADAGAVVDNNRSR